ncbi:MAG: glycosyltransferase family 4 protein [Treponemataceae bacterium]
MVIYQVAYIISNGDAVSNHLLNIDNLLKEQGFTTKILTVLSDSLLQSRREDLYKAKINRDDVVLFHFASGTKVVDWFLDLPCKKGFIYHNITPPHFLRGYSFINYRRTLVGLNQLKMLCQKSDFSIGVSQFNCDELIAQGVKSQNVFLCPIIINYAEYMLEPAKNILAQFENSTGANILFTGRISPNKKIEDCIKTFYYYKNFVDKNARLFLVGSNRLTKYYAQLQGLVSYLKLSDVIFTGHIPFDEIIAYYKLADVFLCMSEHEGFCVPLMEAMYFKVPVIAYKSCAVPETLAESGVLLETKDFTAASDAIKKIVYDKNYTRQILDNQQKRLEYFSFDNTRRIFLDHLKVILEQS